MGRKRGISRALAEQLIAEGVARGSMTPINAVGVNLAAFDPAPAEAPPPAPKGRRKPVALVEPAFTTAAGRAAWTVPVHMEATANGGAMKRWLIGVAGKHRKLVGRALATRPSLLKLAAFRKAIDEHGLLRCTLTRLGGLGMDDDNLQGTAKWCRDTVALFLGQDDGPAGPILWTYAQEPGGAYGVRITLETA